MDFYPTVVSVDWLFEHLYAPDVAIADCRFSLADPHWGQQQYQTGHIPGAYYFDLNRDLSSPVAQHGGRHPLPDCDQLAQTLSMAGIVSKSSRSPSLVVAYDDAQLAFAARFWWLLRYLGHDRVAVLDGGFHAWQAAGYPVTAVTPLPQMGHFVAQVQSQLVADIQDVKAAMGRDASMVLVDSREAERYRGEWEPIDPIAGHIPGAVNYPWQEVTDDQGKVRSRAEQQQRWGAIEPTQSVIVYCGSGVTACVNLLSLALVGHSTAKLYAGSWSDWCSYLQLNLEASTTDNDGIE